MIVLSTRRFEASFEGASPPLAQLPVQLGRAASGAPVDGAFGRNEVKGSVEANTGAKVRYAFRRPRFPIIYAVGSELLAPQSPAALQRQLERLDLHGTKVLDMVDATGEGWAFHSDLMIVSPPDPQEALEEDRRHPALQRERQRAADWRSLPGSVYSPTTSRPDHRRGSGPGSVCKAEQVASADRSSRCSPRPLSAGVRRILTVGWTGPTSYTRDPGGRERLITFKVETEREDDGRWLAEVIELPGVLAYGETQEAAVSRVQALALRVMAERLEHGEAGPELLSISFKAA